MFFRLTYNNFLGPKKIKLNQSESECASHIPTETVYYLFHNANCCMFLSIKVSNKKRKFFNMFMKAPLQK